MVSEKTFEEIKEYEKMGIDVVVVDNSGKLEYSTQGKGGCEFCDQCKSFRLLPDPNSEDWFRDGDMKAVCLEVNGVIASALERPSEWTNIKKPLYCPNLGRELSDEEKEKATLMLRVAKEDMNK